jgi:hypothetical protein
MQPKACNHSFVKFARSDVSGRQRFLHRTAANKLRPVTDARMACLLRMLFYSTSQMSIALSASQRKYLHADYTHALYHGL